MDIDLRRLGRRTALSGILVLGSVIAGTGSAGAHVEATAEGATAGTGPVTVDFFAEAESTTAGIVGVKVQLPTGITPGSVSLASGPSGWTLTPTADGYEAGGPDIGPGVDLEYGITVAQLPRDATELPFKLLLRYSDGQEDAWIELPSDSNPEPANPAPVVTVAPAPPVATSAPPSSTAPSATAAPTATATPSSAATDGAESSDEDGSLSTGAVIGIVAVVLAALGGAAWFWRNRSSRRA